METLDKLGIKIFADGADFDNIVKLSTNPIIKGFTTNPTLARNAGITDYEQFGRKVLAAVPNRPVSLEVFADDFAEMIRQGRTIATWGKNVNVKNSSYKHQKRILRYGYPGTFRRWDCSQCHGCYDGRAS